VLRWAVDCVWLPGVSDGMAPRTSRALHMTTHYHHRRRRRRRRRHHRRYGCWWFCNNPSIISEITRQRLEILGTEFTCQHSDARVLDQLIYKWSHSRKIVGDVLVEKYRDLVGSGWRLTEAEVRRDAEKLFGGSFETFLAKDSSKFDWSSSVVTLSNLGK
jgi:hypothetical protein